MPFYVPANVDYGRYNMLPFWNFYENQQVAVLLSYGDEIIISPNTNTPSNFLALNKITKAARVIGKPSASPNGYPISMVEGGSGRLICYCNGTGFFFSDDRGATWAASTVSGNAYSLAANGDGSVIVAVTGNFITRSVDNGATFINVTPAGFVSGIAGTPASRFVNGLFYALTQQSIWSSVDGLTWTKFDISAFYAGVPFGNISAIEYYDGNFYCGSSNTSLGVILTGPTLDAMIPLANNPVWEGFSGINGACNGLTIAGGRLYAANGTGTILEIGSSGVSGLVVAPSVINANTQKIFVSDGTRIYYAISNQIYTNIVAS